MQLKVVWSLSLQTGSEGPALISNAASRFPMFRVPRSWHTVVCIPIDVDFELSACALRRPHAGIYCCFESVQRHVCDDKRDYAAYDLAYFSLPRLNRSSSLRR